MSYFEFNDSLKIGNKVIDQEHAVLIEYINLLQTAVENNTGTELLGQVLDGLTEYTKTHFFVEEELMKAFGYPAMSNHKAAHESFKRNLETFIRNYEQGDTQITGRTLNFLKEWLTEHILKVDRKLSDFLADKSFR